MIRQDYILRMIEQAAQMIARVLKLGDEENRIGAQELEDETAAKFLKIASGDLEDWESEKIYSHIRGSGPPIEFSIRLGIAITLLNAHADRFRKDGRTAQATAFVGKAIGILVRSKIESQSADVPEFAPGLDKLLNSIEDADIPVEISGLLVCYFEHIGDFGSAEDRLFRMQEIVGDDADIQNLGAGFYQRLLRNTDERLEAGNLPRSEVEQGIVQWNALFQ